MLPRDRGIGFGRGADACGAVLITGSLLAAFVASESTAGNPLVPLRIFRSRNVSGANVIQALTVAGMFGMFFLGVLYLQRVLGYDSLETGLAFLPVTLVIATLSLRSSDRLTMRFGPRTVLLPGLALIAVGPGLVARVPVAGNYLTDVLPATLLMGVGIGVAFPALATLAMSGATPSDAGLASGLVNTTMQVGAALGLAVLATLSATRSQALTGGYRLAFLIAAALVVAAVAVAVTVLRPERQAAEGPEDECDCAEAA